MVSLSCVFPEGDVEVVSFAVIGRGFFESCLPFEPVGLRGMLCFLCASFMACSSRQWAWSHSLQEGQDTSGSSGLQGALSTQYVLSFWKLVSN